MLTSHTRRNFLFAGTAAGLGLLGLALTSKGAATAGYRCGIRETCTETPVRTPRSTRTPVPPTATPVPPTSTPLPPTATSISATFVASSTSVPATPTHVTNTSPPQEAATDTPTPRASVQPNALLSTKPTPLVIVYNKTPQVVRGLPKTGEPIP